MSENRYPPHSTNRRESWLFKHSIECAAMREMTYRMLLDSIERPGLRQWTVQGFGMLRCYVDADKVYRINIWDADLAVPNVSIVHDHPWSFNSWIMSGKFGNQRFEMLEEGDTRGLLHDYMTIKCGVGGGPCEGTKRCALLAKPMEDYTAGDKYRQDASEIYFTSFLNGCVTLNERTRVGDGEHARVFWPTGSSWVDAKPREATHAEIIRAIEGALARWSKVEDAR